MTFDDAMAAHLVWKLRLKRMIDSGTSEGLDVAAVCKDDLCDFGKWIYGAGATHKDSAIYDEVVRKHAEFHACAAEVVKRVEQGNQAGARAGLEGPFETASRQLISAVFALRNEVEKSALQ
ncbi:MAG: hypothetical protein A2040_19575 [Rhodocyclales bacterium GWA2_65_19]|nr:MAG: hypothetical protein A2040_19575 [Rhodocyclales bacterium GWA2_65_19]